jgi:hypothetical protein
MTPVPRRFTAGRNSLTTKGRRGGGGDFNWITIRFSPEIAVLASTAFGARPGVAILRGKTGRRGVRALASSFFHFPFSFLAIRG